MSEQFDITNLGLNHTQNGLSDEIAASHIITPASPVPETLYFIITRISDLNMTRLYWLWIKYMISAAIDQKLEHAAQLKHILNTLEPITDPLSYSLYTLQIVLIGFYYCSYHEQSIASYERQCVSNSLWSISNFLSVTYLSAPSIRPIPYSPGWWGNMSMQILLVYDAMSLGEQYVVMNKKSNQIVPEDSMQEILPSQKIMRNSDKQLFLIQFVHASILIGSFFMYRGNFVQHSSIKPLVGSSLCVGSTIIANGIEYINECQRVHALEKLKKVQLSAKKISCLALVCTGFSITFPIALWASLDTPYAFLTIALGLACITAFNGYTRHEIKKSCSLLVSSSLFNSKSNESAIIPEATHSMV